MLQNLVTIIKPKFIETEYLFLNVREILYFILYRNFHVSLYKLGETFNQGTFKNSERWTVSCPERRKNTMATLEPKMATLGEAKGGDMANLDQKTQQKPAKEVCQD